MGVFPNWGEQNGTKQERKAAHEKKVLPKLRKRYARNITGRQLVQNEILRKFVRCTTAVDAAVLLKKAVENRRYA